MIPALFRGALWLAALAAMLAVVAPEGQPELLAGIAGIAAVSAGLLWRAARGRPALASATVASGAAEPLAIDVTALRDVEARLRQLGDKGNRFDATLHDAANLLKGELGARESTVYRVRRVAHVDEAANDPGIEPQAAITTEYLVELIATPHGFHDTAPIALADRSPLARALAQRRGVVALPEALVLTVVGGDAVTALIELRNIEIAIDHQALEQLLAAADSTLGTIAQRADGVTPTAARAEPSDAPLPAPAAEAAPARHVLLVVDNAADARDTAPHLRRLGCEVRVACGLRHGLQALRETQFDAVLVDFGERKPGDVGAWQAWRRAARDSLHARGSSAVPLIVVQGVAEDTDMQAADESQFRHIGFDGLLRKPLRTDALHTMLNRTPRSLSATPDGTGPAIGATGEDSLHADPEATVLDASALARLAELDPAGASRLLPRVLTAYLNSVARLRPQLLAAQPTLDLEAIRHVTHTLKSSSASIGAVKLAALCAEIDTMIRTADTAELPPRIDSMDAELERVIKAVKQLLGDHP